MSKTNSGMAPDLLLLIYFGESSVLIALALSDVVLFEFRDALFQFCHPARKVFDIIRRLVQSRALIQQSYALHIDRFS